MCDIGCGDGRVILQWAESYSRQTARGASSDMDAGAFPSFVGIDIDSDRITKAKEASVMAQTDGRIDSRINVTFHCINALEAGYLFQDATVLFLYLIPRGLRIFKPLLSQFVVQEGGKRQEEGQQQQQRLRYVLTYMSPLPDETPVRQELIAVPHQPGAAWPLYLYQFEVNR